MQELQSQDYKKEPIPPPEASASLASTISLTLETKRLIGKIEKDVQQIDWDVADLTPLDLAPRLAAPSRHLLAAGGKRVRPLLVFLLGRALNIAPEKMSNCAMAAELVHTATLLHDDVIDGAQTRRGRMTAHLKYDAHTAILSGDALLSKAMFDVAQDGKAEVLAKLALTLRELVEGECLQADLVGKVHEQLDSVLEICRRKTGSLFAWCGWSAGFYAGRHAEELRKFGYQLGLAFQMLDDLLDWEGDEIGKRSLQDLSEAKLNTVGVILCMKSRNARTILQNAFENLNSNRELEDYLAVGKKLKQLPEYKDALSWVQERAEKETALAIANLEILPDSQWKELTKQITMRLLSRMK